MDKFTYYRSVLSKNVTIDDEVNNRLAKASATFVWDCEGLSTHTKLRVYKTVVLSTLLCACETWTVYSRHVRKLNQFHLNCLHRILHIQWWHKVPDTEVLNHAELSSIHTYLCKAQLHWAGHVLRMHDEHFPKCLLVGEVIEGKTSIWVQKKHFKDTIKASLTQCIMVQHLMRVNKQVMR